MTIIREMFAGTCCKASKVAYLIDWKVVIFTYHHVMETIRKSSKYKLNYYLMVSPAH